MHDENYRNYIRSYVCKEYKFFVYFVVVDSIDNALIHLVEEIEYFKNIF